MDGMPLKISDAINRLHTAQSIALINLATELLDIQDGSVEDAILLLSDGAPLNDAERDVVKYWIVEIAKERSNANDGW